MGVGWLPIHAYATTRDCDGLLGRSDEAGELQKRIYRDEADETRNLKNVDY